MRFDHVPRLMRTVRHLRSSQLWWRTRYLVERKLPLSLLNSSAEPARVVQIALRDEPFPHVPPFHRLGPTRSAAVEQIMRGEFQHLHQTVKIGRIDPDWQHGGDAAGRLWSITLHYHGWVYDLAEAAVQGDDRALPLLQQMLEHWLAHCRLQQIGPGNLIWNAFSIATRLGWWVRALDLFDRSGIELEHDFHAKWLHSISRQAQFLSHHLEWDLRGNHLIRDAVGLAWAGRYLDGRSADKWLNLATEIAESQAVEQVLPDGGHFERSPMYHIHVLEDLLTLAELVTQPRCRQRLRDICRQMAEFVSWVRHPDGSLPLFNDAAHGAVSAPDELLHRMRELGYDAPQDCPRGLKQFEETGLIVWHGDPWSLFWDVGDVGPSYQPGHAHADTLTLECSFGGERMIVDPGTFGYDRNDRRRYDRSTVAHNTVSVDGLDSSEMWHIFRVGSRARPLGVDVIPRRQGFTAWAAHTGYDQRPGSPRHARQVTVEERQTIRITDQVQGLGKHTLEGGWLLAPPWQATATETGWTLQHGRHTVRVCVAAKQPVQLSVERRPWHPEYGCEIETSRLVWRVTTELPFEVVTTFDPPTA
jgi:uncharacterized heparinase superfamily protein